MGPCARNVEMRGGANRLRKARFKGAKSRGGGVSKSSTNAKGVHLGWTGPMRGSAQKAESCSTKVQPAAFSSAMERVPEEGVPSAGAQGGAVGDASEESAMEDAEEVEKGAAGGVLNGLASDGASEERAMEKGAEAAKEGVPVGRAAEDGAFSSSTAEPVDMELPVDVPPVESSLITHHHTPITHHHTPITHHHTHHTPSHIHHTPSHTITHHHTPSHTITPPSHTITHHHTRLEWLWRCCRQVWCRATAPRKAAKLRRSGWTRGNVSWCRRAASWLLCSRRGRATPSADRTSSR